MIYPMRISQCTSTIETAVYANRTHGGVRGRELVTPSYSIVKLHVLRGAVIMIFIYVPYNLSIKKIINMNKIIGKKILQIYSA